MRKYGVKSFPSFVYVKPGNNGKTATRFQEARSYETLKRWMEKLIILHGGEPMAEEEDPVFISDEKDDDLAMEEDDEISEMIKRLKRAKVKMPKNVEMPEPEEEHDHDHEEEDEDEEDETEIVSIVDTTTGEELNFHIEGEDFEKIKTNDFFANLKTLVRKNTAIIEDKADLI